MGPTVELRLAGFYLPAEPIGDFSETLEITLRNYVQFGFKCFKFQVYILLQKVFCS